MRPLLGEPRILDVDATVKPLYGHQQTAEVSYNTSKRGRPSHVHRSYLMAELSIGAQKGPRIGAQKGPLRQRQLSRSSGSKGGRARSPRRSAAPDRRPIHGRLKPQRFCYRAGVSALGS